MSERKQRIDYSVNLADCLTGKTFSQARVRLAELEDRYGNLVISEIPHEYKDGDYLGFSILRDETDKEMNERIKRETELAQWREQNRRAQYEALKKEFGDG